MIRSDPNFPKITLVLNFVYSFICLEQVKLESKDLVHGLIIAGKSLWVTNVPKECYVNH